MKAFPAIIFKCAVVEASDDPIRRHYYDSGANEGHGILCRRDDAAGGLFDDSPRTREMTYNSCGCGRFVWKWM